jgi:hypothetical protein
VFRTRTGWNVRVFIVVTSAAEVKLIPGKIKMCLVTCSLSSWLNSLFRSIRIGFYLAVHKNTFFLPTMIWL